jgi:glycosyltransferase involved in cell wall biosynthesis/peptidoglycan/xylan/chitin deacetylase (PgdA/CDA1 family)
MISVVIPIYNAEKHLEATLKSVLDQTFRDFELILINDGSTDRSLDIVSKFKDGRIKLFSQDNYGVSYARNKGAYLAQYDYLAFLDADDVWHPEYLSKKLTFIQNNNVDMVFCYEQDINDNYEKQEKYYLASELDFFEKIITIHPDYAVGPSNLFIKRKAFISSVGFNQALSNTADKMMLIDLLNEYSYANIHDVLIYYKTHGSNMHKNIKKTKTDFEIFKKCLEANYFNTKKYADLESVFKSRYSLIMAYYSLKSYRFLLCLLNIFRSFTHSPGTFFNYLSLKNKIRKYTFTLMFKAGLFNLLLKRNIRTNRRPIALFHRVSPLPDHIWSPLKPHEFENIIIQFKKYFTPVSLSDFLSKKDLPANAISIVFDDGFASLKQFALPILKKHNIPCDLFVSTTLIEEQKPIWTYELGTLIRLTSQKEFDFNFKGKKLSFDLSTERHKNNCSKELIEVFKAYNIQETNEAITQIKNELGDTSALEQRLLTTKELEDLQNDVAIHSHSADHYYLTNLTEQELETSLSDSLTYIKSHFNPSKHLIAYPIGDYNQKVIEKVKAVFDYGFIVSDRSVDFNKLDKGDYNLRVPRFNIHHNNPTEVLFKLVGFHGFFRFNQEVNY